MYSLNRESVKGVWFFIALNAQKQLVGCAFSSLGSRQACLKLLTQLPYRSKIEENPTNNHSSQIFQTLSRLYEGKIMKRKLPLSFENIPAFYRKCLEVTMEIPRGYVSSYGEIAKKLGNKGAARAVGSAEARNPFPLIIPCHRVIKSTLEMGEYGGGRDVKRMLLKREGVHFDGDKISRKSFWTF
jgi:methylated-DNA-[protein]-cysteine S-methyltransferase